MTDSSVQANAEHEVRDALARYKVALMYAHYRNWWHKLLMWLDDDEAKQADSALSKVEAEARSVVRRSEDHRQYLYLVSSQQLDYVRERDKFLSLLD